MPTLFSSFSCATTFPHTYSYSPALRGSKPRPATVLGCAVRISRSLAFFFLACPKLRSGWRSSYGVHMLSSSLLIHSIGVGSYVKGSWTGRCRPGSIRTWLTPSPAISNPCRTIFFFLTALSGSLQLQCNASAPLCASCLRLCLAPWDLRLGPCNPEPVVEKTNFRTWAKLID